MAYLAVLSAISGRRAGLAATAGIALGLLIVGVIAAMGVAAAINQSRFLYEALRWAGIAYLLWLAWDGWQDAEETSPGRTTPEANLDGQFIRGLITNLLNPKAAVFYIAILPPFIVPDRPVVLQTIGLSVVYVAVATAIHAGIVLLAASARPYLEDPALGRRVRRILSLALAAIAVWFAVSTAR